MRRFIVIMIGSNGVGTEGNEWLCYKKTIKKNNSKGVVGQFVNLRHQQSRLIDV